MMGVSYDEMNTTEEDGRVTLSLYSRSDSHLLIGPRGTHLSSLTLVLRALLNKEEDDPVHFFVDVNDYHKKNMDAIKQKALVVAERVRSFQTDTELDPMSSFERRFVHALFGDAPDIETESRGEGRERRVVIKYVQQTDL